MLNSESHWCSIAPMNWSDIKFFNAVAKARSIRGAAIKMRISHSTVSRRINELEKSLEVRLFERLRDGYFLTETGEAFYKVSQDFDEGFYKLERIVLDNSATLTGEIRVTMPDIYAKLLMDDFCEFSNTYPCVDLKIIPSYNVLNISQREADIALRVIDKNVPEHLVGRELIAHTLAPYASKDYIDKHSPLNTSTSVTWIGWNDTSSNPGWIKKTPLPDSSVKHCITNVLIQLEAAKSGMGVAFLPCFLGDAEPSLCRIPESTPIASGSVWILTHPDIRYSMRIKLFMRFLADAIDNHSGLILGDLTVE